MSSKDCLSYGELLDCEEAASSEGLAESCSLSPEGGDRELDYNEAMDTDRHCEPQVKDTITEDEDEVNIHATGDIEEGEISSDEEGEIKESDDNEYSGSKMKQKTVKVTKAEPLSSDEDCSSQSKAAAAPAAHSPELKPLPSPPQAVSEESRDEESPDSDRDVKKMKSYHSPPPKRHIAIVKKIPTLCRHFANGKCSWGDECRFLHTDPAEDPSVKFLGQLAPRERLVMPPLYPGPPRAAMHLRGPPGGYPAPAMRGFQPGFPPRPPHLGHPHEIPPHFAPIHHEVVHPHGFVPRRAPPPLPPNVAPPFKGPGGVAPAPPLGANKTAEVAEESVGWYRLRTVTEEWNSDQEGDKNDLDLRDVLKRKKLHQESESETGGEVTRPEEWTDPWDRQARKDAPKPKKRKTKDSSRPVGSDLDSGSEKEGNPVTNKRAIGKSSGARKTPATVVSLSHDSCSSESESDVMQQKRKKKKKLAKTKLKKWKQEREESRVVGSAEKTKHKTSTSRKLTKDSTPEDKKKKRSKGKSSKHHSDEPSSMDEVKYVYEEPSGPPFPPGPARDSWQHPPHGQAAFMEPYPMHHPSHFGPAYVRQDDFSPRIPGWRQMDEGDPPYYPPPRVANRVRQPADTIPQQAAFDSQLAWKGHKQVPQQRGSSESGSHSPTPAPDSCPSSADTSPDRTQRLKSSHPTHSPSSEKRSKHVSKGSDNLKKTLSRREKLLQELQAIDKNIQRKKSQKH